MARKFKKVDGGHGHHGGAWKVAYADFVTAMMALFMVLWLLASTDSQSRKEISNYFRTGLLPQVDLSTAGRQPTMAVFMSPVIPNPQAPSSVPGGSAGGTGSDAAGGLGADALGGAGDGDGNGSGTKNTGVGDERVRAANALVKRLNRFAAVDDELAQVLRSVHIQVTSEGIVIEAVDEGNGLLFDMASAKLNEPLERFLRALGPALAALDKQIEINGHTDARPFVNGARLSNWDLSYQRAASAREILEASGIPSQRVSGVFARGSSQLYMPKDPLAPQNRRLSILIKIQKGGSKLAAPEGQTPEGEDGGEAKIDELKADEPKADEPKADEPKADEPKADEPKADEPKADEPKSRRHAREPEDAGDAKADDDKAAGKAKREKAAGDKRSDEPPRRRDAALEPRHVREE